MSTVSLERSGETKKQPPTEIERKFLVTSLPEEIDLDEMQGEYIEQGYLANGSGRNTVRIRRKGERYFWTVKQRNADNPVKRPEYEVEITEHQYTTMWPTTEGRRIQKTRYEIPHGDHTIELDIFKGANEGHMIAEVEFDTVDDAEAYVPPDWFGPDVTADGRYGNANISKAGFPADISSIVVLEPVTTS